MLPISGLRSKTKEKKREVITPRLYARFFGCTQTWDMVKMECIKS
jgi:hypothetical protein